MKAILMPVGPGISFFPQSIGEMGDEHNKNIGLGSLEESVNRLINRLHDIKAVGVNIEFERALVGLL